MRYTKAFDLIILLVPVVFGIAIIGYIVVGKDYVTRISNAGSANLITENWELAYNNLKKSTPNNDMRFAYYEVKEGETVEKVAQHFSISPKVIVEMNPGPILPGTTIKISPIKKPLTPQASNGLIKSARIIIDESFVRVRGDFEDPKIVVTIDELAEFLSEHDVLRKKNNSTWQILKPLSIEENIRIDLTSKSLKRLELRSDPRDITCLCLEDAEILIDGIEITTFNSKTGEVDRNPDDERSYVRARKSTRMDILNSDLSFLGNGIELTKNSDKQVQMGGGVYGISWRIPDDRLGKDIVTGWVENNRFHSNHFGSYSYGASGMKWLKNHYFENEVYGLDPHDDSNNALVEDNLFEKNGTHGFIISKRCNYNVIRNNISKDNGLHGFMIHQDSVYNIIENNIAENNTDNYAIYASSYNIIRNNKGESAKNAHVRINKDSHNNYITNNNFRFGDTGVLLYDNTTNTMIDGNSFKNLKSVIKTKDNVKTVVIHNNTVPSLEYRFEESENIVYGLNTVDRSENIQ